MASYLCPFAIARVGAAKDGCTLKALSLNTMESYRVSPIFYLRFEHIFYD